MGWAVKDLKGVTNGICAVLCLNSSIILKSEQLGISKESVPPLKQDEVIWHLGRHSREFWKHLDFLNKVTETSCGVV